MRLNVHRCTAKQQIERQQESKQPATSTPRHNHQDSGNTHMRTGESRRGTFANLLRTLYQIVEEPMIVSRSGQQLLIMVEVIPNGREHSLRHIIVPDSRKIELRTCHRNKDINQIIDKERGDQHERQLLEVLKPIDKVPDYYNQYHRIVEEVSHIERLTHPHMREAEAEPHRRLSAEHPLFCRSKNMVQVREYPVKLKCIGIPIGKQRHLYGYAHKGRELTGCQPVKIHQQECHTGNHGTVNQHLSRMIHFLKKKQDQNRSQQIVYKCYLLYCKQPLPGFYLFK